MVSDWRCLTTLTFITLFEVLQSTLPDPPVIEVIPTSDLNPHWQTTFTLHCKTADWPETTVFFWKRDGATLYPYDDSRIHFSGPDKQSLIFEDTTLEQSGTYTCIATEFRQYIFESSDTVQVNIQEPPHVPDNLAIVNKTSTSIVLRWEPQGDVATDQYIVTQQPGDYAYTCYDTSIEITTLRPYSIYTFGVAAHNPVGSRGKSNLLQIRTDPDRPSGLLDFNVGVRTSTSLQVEWKVPGVWVVNDQLLGYILQLHDTELNLLVQSHNFSSNETETTLASLSPETKYTVTMGFLSRCCASTTDSKDAETVSEGETLEPTIQPRTEGNTAVVGNATLIGIIVGVLAVIIVLFGMLTLLCYRRTRRASTRKTPRWNDGTQDGANDLIPISPPPEYTPGVQPSTDNASSNIQNASLSRSFCFNAQTTSPPPAYHSRDHSRTSSNNNSISSVSNVGGALSDTEDEIKEQNVPTPPRTAGLCAPCAENHAQSAQHQRAQSTPQRQGPPRDTWI